MRKFVYAYYLAPAGIAEKAHVTLRFPGFHMNQVEGLEREIDELRREAIGKHPG